MKHVIHKFTIDAPSKIIRTDPRLQFLHVATQRGMPCVWAIVDVDAEPEDVLIQVFRTGYDSIDYNKHIYIGTWQDQPLGLVWHLFRGTLNA